MSTLSRERPPAPQPRAGPGGKPWLRLTALRCPTHAERLPAQGTVWSLYVEHEDVKVLKGKALRKAVRVRLPVSVCVMQFV
jgi:hypothetical protein